VPGIQGRWQERPWGKAFTASEKNWKKQIKFKIKNEI